MHISETTGAEVLSLLGAYEELFGKIPLSLMTDERAIAIMTTQRNSAYALFERIIELFVAGVVLIAAVVALAGARDSRAIDQALNGRCSNPTPPTWIRQAIVRAFPEEPRRAILVACCESDFDVDVISRTSDVGVMQVNTRGGGRRLLGRWYSVRYLQTVEGNLQAARVLYVDAGRTFWRDWQRWRWKTYPGARVTCDRQAS